MNKSLCSTITAAFLLLIDCASSQHAANAGESRFASFGTNKVHYAVEGKGSRAIVFVHCWAMK